MLIVAKHGSINRSALALNTSQPTLTRRLRRLELALGRHVLERSGTGVCLTAFGRDIAEHGRVIERALAAIAQLADLSHVQDIYLGATQLAAELILPRAIHSISAAPSQMRVVAQEGTCEALLRQLQEGELDVLIASPGVKAKEVPGVDFRPLFSAPIRCDRLQRASFGRLSVRSSRPKSGQMGAIWRRCGLYLKS